MEVNLNEVATGVVTAIAIGTFALAWVQFTTYGRKAWESLGKTYLSFRWAIVFLSGILVTEAATFYIAMLPINAVVATTGNILKTDNGYVSYLNCISGTAIGGGCFPPPASKKGIFLRRSGINYNADGSSGFECLYGGGDLENGEAGAYVACAEKARVRWRIGP